MHIIHEWLNSFNGMPNTFIKDDFFNVKNTVPYGTAKYQRLASVQGQTK